MSWENRGADAVLSETDARRGLEERAEVDSLELLHTKRRALIEQNGKLLAMYGPFGMFDDRRKRMVEAMKIKARMDLNNEGAKTTESMVDARAYGSDEYERFLDTALAEKIEWLRVSTSLDDLAERIRDRELGISAYAKEISLR